MLRILNAHGPKKTAGAKASTAVPDAVAAGDALYKLCYENHMITTHRASSDWS